MGLTCVFPSMGRSRGAHLCELQFPVSPRPLWHESGTAVCGLVAADATAQTRVYGWGVQNQAERFMRAMRSRLPDREASLRLGVCSMRS